MDGKQVDGNESVTVTPAVKETEIDAVVSNLGANSVSTCDDIELKENDIERQDVETNEDSTQKMSLEKFNKKSKLGK